MTKKQGFEELMNLVQAVEGYNMQKEMIEFLTHEIEVVDNRTERERTRRLAKAGMEEDLLLAAVQNALGTEYVSAEDIVAAIDEELNATRAKVVSRLTKLIKAGVVVKDTVKDEAGTRTSYKLA